MRIHEETVAAIDSVAIVELLHWLTHAHPAEICIQVNFSTQDFFEL